MTEPMEASRTLILLLSQVMQDSLTSIEILPGGLQDWETVTIEPDATKPHPGFPFLLVKGNLGIPKKILYKLYVAAMAMQRGAGEPQESIAVSTIILLLNPAHQTALNTRKRLVIRGFLDPKKELNLFELVLHNSNECAKQSIIWDYRRWCFRRMYGTIGSSNPSVFPPVPENWATSEEASSFPVLSPASIRQELAIIQHACESYPRNYHAWTHWHFIMNVCYVHAYRTDNSHTEQNYLGIMFDEYIRLRDWLDYHVSDYSAINQLCQLQTLLDNSQLWSPSQQIPGDLAPLALAKKSISLVKTYPSHESPWMFLRISLGKITGGWRAEILKEIEGFAPSSSNYFSKQLQSWFERQLPEI